MVNAIQISNLEKSYKNSFKALSDIEFSVKNGEIFALLGPNGAGKTTLINAICGIIKIDNGTIDVLGANNIRDYRLARSYIGLVPQELTTDAFETVWNTVSFSRGLFGKKPDKNHIQNVLQSLKLWDKKDSQIRMLSGGMKRRVMIAKALSHEPKILFLDEPSAGVDVELRKSMWNQVKKLKESGVTIILTTHYIEEAEEMADRVGVMNKGKLILIEDKKKLMKKLGKKELIITLSKSLKKIPDELTKFNLNLVENRKLIFTFDPQKTNNEVSYLLESLRKKLITFNDINIKESSLEEIFVGLVGKNEF